MLLLKKKKCKFIPIADDFMKNSKIMITVFLSFQQRIIVTFTGSLIFVPVH